MKKIVIILTLMVISLPFFAESWIVTGNSNLNLSQNYYSKSWVGDEISSLTWVLTSNFTAKKQLNKILLNENSLTLSFGQTHKYDKQKGKWLKPEKSTDNINALSLLKFTLQSYVDPFIGLKIETQFYNTNGILNPATFTESFGISKDIFANKNLSLSSRFGGAFKEEFNKANYNTPISGGIEFVSSFQTKLCKDIALFTSNLNVYKAIFHSDSDKLENDYWKAPDINFENILAIGLSKYVAFQIYTQLLYDKEIKLNGRFKENISLSLNYKLF